MESNGEIRITLNSIDKVYQYDTFGLTFESTDDQIVEALTPVLLEEEGFNLSDEYSDGAYTIKRMDNSNNIYIFPKSTAGAR